MGGWESRHPPHPYSDLADSKGEEARTCSDMGSRKQSTSKGQLSCCLMGDPAGREGFAVLPASPEVGAGVYE